MPLEWILFIFVFVFGSCIGSFLNVVIYRLPLDLSIVKPPSSCPGCDHPIAFYDNIPLLSWLLLRGKCRNCHMKISPRYFIVELITAVCFAGVFYWFFIYGGRQLGIVAPDGYNLFLSGGWLFYLITMILIASFLAASAIDLELWIIPLSICWFVSIAGIICSGVAPFVIEPGIIKAYNLFPAASGQTAALTVGAGLGIVLSLLAVGTGIIKPSYYSEKQEKEQEQEKNSKDKPEVDDDNYNHRIEALRETFFLLPSVLLALSFSMATKKFSSIGIWWTDFSQIPVVAGLCGSLWGYLVGCLVVWITRILGTLAFGKEAMGLGDMHLMGAAGAVLGPVFVVIAFFVAPFFGLIWAIYQMFLKKTRQIPYGPFLSLGVFVVIIFNDWIRDYISNLYFGQ